MSTWEFTWPRHHPFLILNSKLWSEYRIFSEYPRSTHGPRYTGWGGNILGARELTSQCPLTIHEAKSKSSGKMKRKNPNFPWKFMHRCRKRKRHIRIWWVQDWVLRAWGAYQRWHFCRTWTHAHCRNRPVIPQPVLATNDAEPGDAAIIIQYIEPLRTSGCRQTRYNINFPRATYVHFKIFLHEAAFDEVLIGLRFVEAAHKGPHRFKGSVDSLRQ